MKTPMRLTHVDGIEIAWFCVLDGEIVPMPAAISLDTDWWPLALAVRAAPERAFVVCCHEAEEEDVMRILKDEGYDQIERYTKPPRPFRQ